MSEPATDQTATAPVLAYHDLWTDDYLCRSCLHERDLSSTEYGIAEVRLANLRADDSCDRCGGTLGEEPTIHPECLRFGYIQDGVCKGHAHATDTEERRQPAQ